MKVVIDIPKDFEGDYIVDKFKDFFLRVIADIDCKGLCGRYEEEIAEMFLKVFDDSNVFDDSEEKIHFNCQHNSNSRENESCCRCDSRHTNADRIRNMSDEELACVIEKIKMCGGLIRTETTSAECNGCKDGYCCNVMQWLQSEAE